MSEAAIDAYIAQLEAKPPLYRPSEGYNHTAIRRLLRATSIHCIRCRVCLQVKQIIDRPTARICDGCRKQRRDRRTKRQT